MFSNGCLPVAVQVQPERIGDRVVIKGGGRDSPVHKYMRTAIHSLHGQECKQASKLVENLSAQSAAPLPSPFPPPQHSPPHHQTSVVDRLLWCGDCVQGFLVQTVGTVIVYKYFVFIGLFLGIVCRRKLILKGKLQL